MAQQETRQSSAIHILRPEESPIGVSVRPYVEGGERRPPRLLDNTLVIQDDGMIVGVPGNVSGFQLNILAPKESVVCQRDRVNNEYYGLQRGSDQPSDPELEYRQMRVEVYSHREWGFYTLWLDKQHPRSSNNVALWEVEPDGHVAMWEVGIVSPNGRDFYVAHDIRWDGKLYVEAPAPNDSWMVGVPSAPKYGSFYVRQDILDYKPFQDALPSTLPKYEDTGEDLDPPLALPSEPNMAIIDWWHMFMGMGRGQGIVLCHDGTSAWLHGQDIEGLDPDKLVQLERGQRLELVPHRNGKIVLKDMGKTPRVVNARLI